MRDGGVSGITLQQSDLEPQKAFCNRTTEDAVPDGADFGVDEFIVSMGKTPRCR
ncbi:UNVERIFIED_ORG: hypothetical protein M2435_006599 [Rhizobium sophorae]|nr:hypothetical protein [Rhizobium leguminosarum]MDH6663653.1 hypothetical protein [Rhizobium sophorae]